MASISVELAHFVRGLSYEQIPAAVIDKAKLHILDVIGIGLSSSRRDYGRSSYRAARALGSGGECTVIGFPDQMPAASAVLVNGTLIHGLDYDDTHIEGIVHSGVTVIPTALAAGEETGADGRTVLAAIVAGFEVVTRLGIAAQGQLHPRGFHPTSVFGSLSSSLIAGRLYGLPAEVMASAMGLAGGTMASGLLEIGESWLKRLNPGWAAHAGITAALLAKEGFIGPESILEGNNGLYASHLYGGTYQLEALTRGLGLNWETLNIGFKPYPCCHFLHASLDCSKMIRERHGFDPDQVEEIVCLISEPLMALATEGFFRPKTEYAAQFSVPFTVATMLTHGKLDLESFSLERLSDPTLNRLIDKTRLEVDRQSEYPKNFPGQVTVKTRQGQTFERRETVNRGTKDNPLSKDEVVRKFRENVSGVIEDEAARGLIDMVERFEEIADVRQFTKCLAGKQR